MMQIIKIATLFCLSVLINKTVYAQRATMVHAGEIEFEKRLNAYAILDEYFINDKTSPQTQQFAQQYKTGKPQFGITNFTLSFNDDCSLYYPNNHIANIPEVSLLQTSNTVYVDLSKHISISKKAAFDDEFLVIDSARKILWKMTDETKEIAGFTCRRANAVIMDSVYVVAFYTDQIIPRSGPESFTGLPGMILGIALPHQHITWFAKRINIQQVSEVQLKAPTGGKKVNNNELLKLLINDPSMKMNGQRGHLLVQNYML